MRKRFKIHLYSVGLAFVFFLFSLGTVAEAKKQSLEQRISKMTFAQQAMEVASAMATIQRVHKFITNKYAEARKKKDLTAKHDLEELLTTSRALLLIAERSKVSFDEAVIQKNKANSLHYLAKILRTKEQMIQLETKARLVGGKSGFYDGKTKVIVTGESKTLGGSDTTNPPRVDEIPRRVVDSSSFY